MAFLEKFLSIDLLAKETLATNQLSEEPGVYIFKDPKGDVLYVGKSSNVKRRLLSYLKAQPSSKTASMLKKASHFGFILTQSEKEALILEAQLIKKFRPPYNVVLRDDKNYPLIKIDPSEKFPRIEITRIFKRDGAFYFGPYPSVQALKEVLKFLRRAFPLRKCSTNTFIKRERPCLNYDIGLCLGPCSGKISPQEYRKVVRDLINFLNGQDSTIKEKLFEEMKRASENLEFEKAALYRDRIKAIDLMMERQSVITSEDVSSKDVFGFYLEEDRSIAFIIFIRQGAISGQRHFDISNAIGSEKEIVESFIKQYYELHPFIPEEIVLPIEIETKEILEKYLEELRGGPVTISFGKTEHDKRLLEMASKNAINHAKMASLEAELMNLRANKLKEFLGLDFLPELIGCLDISNLQGKHTVGAVVVFKKGIASPELYRAYTFESVDKPNDPVMIKLTLKRFIEEEEELFSSLDLLIIDGGKSQLKGALEALDGFYHNKPFVVAIAKDRTLNSKVERLLSEKLYIPGSSEPLSLPEEILRFIQKIRDEAHRFALKNYQKVHRKFLKASILDNIKGIGKKRKEILLKYFKDIEAISKAQLEELMAIPGISPKVAKNIYEFFHPLR